jgi:hypothetical protein
MKNFAAALLTSILTAASVAQTTPAQTATPIEYRFDDVKRTVTLTSAQKELRVARGQLAQGGDKVQTGWFSYALISSERYRAKFEIFASTDVVLTQNEPGVILSVERGKLRAMFDKITGNEPRIVKTPGALLAVRGTQYDIEVDDSGNTTLHVFEGIVEVRSELRREPLLVPAGQMANFSRRNAPAAHPMPPDNNKTPNNGRTPDGRDPHGAQPPPPQQQPPHGAPPPPNPGGHH